MFNLCHLGHHECEILGRGLEAAESDYAWKKCKKNRGHRGFIPVGDFMANQLPRSLSEEECEYLKVAVDLTVRLRVNRTSLDRPGEDELSEYGGSERLRVGTGFIRRVSDPRTNKPCPCDECRGQKVRKFWTFIIHTAIHVVYNTEEAKETLVDLFYDDKYSRQTGRMETMRGLRFVWSRPDSDACGMECVTHDETLAKRIEALYQKLVSYKPPSSPKPRKLGLVDRFRKMFVRGWQGHALIISHPHGQPKMATVGKALGELKKFAGYVEYYTTTCSGSSGAAVIPLYSEPGKPQSSLPHYMWGFVHCGTHDKPFSPFKRQVNYGHF